MPSPDPITASLFLEQEYRRLWEDYGLDSPPVPLAACETETEAAALTSRPTPEGESPFLIVVEMPTEPQVAFVVQLPIEYQRLRKEEEALWERMLQALALSREAIALLKIFPLLNQRQEAALPHFLWALPLSVRWVVFFGASPFYTATHTSPPLGLWSPFSEAEQTQGQWLVTHDLGTLTRDPNSKKETWNHLKDLPQRLK